jgi:hypothetical protein
MTRAAWNPFTGTRLPGRRHSVGRGGLGLDDPGLELIKDIPSIIFLVGSLEESR